MKHLTKEKIYFVSCIIEQYKKHSHLSGRECLDYLDKFGIIQWLYDFYETLHSQNYNNVVKEIDERIQKITA